MPPTDLQNTTSVIGHQVDMGLAPIESPTRTKKQVSYHGESTSIGLLAFFWRRPSAQYFGGSSGFEAVSGTNLD
ncbi:hypothetical protein FOPE_00901 [Fonsecaea pedrosoi]|nr:hypothetical protein FOPE_00901 [Fonsecaea pedrosoi]